MLFLSQPANEASEPQATRELSRFGFAELHLAAGKPISVEALNAPNMSAFHKH
jgi:hypothetical protein